MTERSTSAAAPRRRLSADEARARIMQAAERKLAEVGPEGLRLTELAAELGISHPAILHHFGSREELVAAVVTSATGRLNQRLSQAIASRAHGRAAILDMVADFYAAEGHARLIAWLVLSGRALDAGGHGETARPLQHLIELAHDQRTQAHPERDCAYEDTQFRAHLTALALLGDAIFGDLIRYASGAATGAQPSRDFRHRLASLLAETE